MTSLPGGRLGTHARAFVDWLAAAGQSWWQILPLAPPDRSGSPYTSTSAFAAWPGLLAEPAADVADSEIAAFRAAHGYWIRDWERFAGPGAVADQVRFEREWSALRRYAGERGVRLIGDIPLYVGPRSADHRSHPRVFQRGFVAGAPPDRLSATGQLWGNPLYDWTALRREGYRWWIERLRRASQLADVNRIDHFRGLVAYWSVPAGARTRARGPLAPRARSGALRRRARGARRARPDRRGPRRDHPAGRAPAARARGARHGGAAIRLRRRPAQSPPAREPCPSCSSSTRARTTRRRPWAGGDSLSPTAQAATGLDPAEPHWSLMELALRSRAALSIFPAQDVLGLGDEARMNRPGTTVGNWRWRLEQGQLTGELAARLRAATERSGRLPR